ncbi:acyltransferase [Kocuria massiliensis]|uniref:acyltransferase n=1 Tax=Kocuria massiliensis TaxID=1926282 RepID=UPI000A1C80C7|nr:acyltransferase [Kocuria massiliensis]
MKIIQCAREVKHFIFTCRKRLSPSARYSRRLRIRGVRLSKTAFVAPGSLLERGVVVGDRSWVNYGAFIERGTTIGNGVAIGPNATICTATHEFGPEDARAGHTTKLPVTIEDGCWFGACVTVLPGVTIGRGCVIAAGALVRRDCEPNGLYAGVPARRVRDLD